MDTKQPNALRLADALGRAPKWQQLQAAAEMRRLHAENEALRTGYDAARLEIESLQARVQELGQMARDCNSRRVLELEAQLDAVGAGGVEPLRKRECLHSISEPEAQPVGVAPEWWRKRADEIETDVARGGSIAAMNCYTKMRQLLQAATSPQPAPKPPAHEPLRCPCHTCWPIAADDPASTFMRLCPACGNKRCPKANDHRHACTGSNEPGQHGSAYPAHGITAAQKGDAHGQPT